MNEKDGNVNGVNETHATSEGVTPGRVTGGQQPAPGRYPATARAKWSKILSKQGVFLGSLGNLLLPGTNDETSFNIINSCANL